MTDPSRPMLISSAELARLWEDNLIPAKRANGMLTNVIVDETASNSYPGGVSTIVKLLTHRGQHIGTVHEIVMPDGSIAHGHPKDYTARDCTRFRAD